MKLILNLIPYQAMNIKLKSVLFFVVTCFSGYAASAQQLYRLKPDRVFDGKQIHNNWEVLVQGNKIIAAGTPASIPFHAKAQVLHFQAVR
jgi:hypothetical protein